MTNLPSDFAVKIGDNELENGILASVALGILTVVLLVLLSALGAFQVISIEVVKVAAAGLVLLAGVVTGGIIILAWLRSQRHRADVVDKWRDWIDAEIKRKSAAPGLPAPAYNPPVVTTGLSVAEREAIGGIDNKDLRAFFTQILAWDKWTETMCENWIVPSAGKPLGKEMYARIMARMVQTACIVDRGGAGNKSGKLTTRDVDELMRKVASSAPPPSAQV